MIWVTLRRYRLALLLFTIAAAGLTAWAIVVHHDYVVAVRGLHRCAGDGIGRRCSALLSGEHQAYGFATVIRILLIMLPGVIGVALGAPLIAGELENRSAVFALTQSVSRTRWVVMRWAVIGLAVTVLTAALGAVAYWFCSLPISPDEASTFARIQPGTFDVTGLVPVAYGLFAFSLGAALGAVFRRTGFAVMGTIAGFVFVRLQFLFAVRPNLAPRRFLSVDAPMFTNVGRGRWYTGAGYRLTPGNHHHLTQQYIDDLGHLCGQLNEHRVGPDNFFGCLEAHGIQFGEWFQPANHYWGLQLGEAGAFLAGALALLGVTVWAVRRWSA